MLLPYGFLVRHPDMKGPSFTCSAGGILVLLLLGLAEDVSKRLVDERHAHQLHSHHQESSQNYYIIIGTITTTLLLLLLLLLD